MSIFDTPKKTLSRDVFNKNKQMHPRVKNYLISDLAQFMPPNSIQGLYLLGSMARRNYSDTSDLDIYIHLKPPYTREELDEYVDQYKERPLPGTQHPVNYFVDDPEEVDFTTSKYGVYDILNEKWIVEPRSYKEIKQDLDTLDNRFDYAKMYAKTWEHATPMQQRAMMRMLEIRKNFVYSTGWGTPHDSLQNILFKYMEDVKPEYAPEG